jgi:RNA polymerase sigma-70 factor, ECF subfamily
MSTLFGRDPLANPERLIRRVYAYAAYRLGDGPDAEDVTSEVFERALRYRSSFDRSKGEPATWLLGIARRCTAATLAARADNRRELVPASNGGLPPIDGSSLEDAAVRRLTLGAALSQLSERDQELIALRFGADLTAAQIAQLLETRTNAVEVALHRALARVRSILEGQEANPAVSPRTLETGAR